MELFPGRTSTIVLNNDRRPNLTIYKRDADSGALIPDTVFLIKTADGHSVAEVKTGPDGSATVPNLWPGVFEISEKSVPSPYLLDAPSQLVTLYPNRDRDVYFENHKSPIIEILKESSITHEPLANVRFQVWYASNNTSTGEFNDLGVFTTDENGRIELTGPDNGLKDGWFRVKELEPPTGYSIKDSDTQEAFVAAGKGHTFFYQNTPLSALVVWKYDTVSGAVVPNCRFQLRYLGGDTSGSGGTIIGTYVTSKNGSFTVTGLKAGYYICEELSSDGDHIIDTAPQTAYISGKDQDVVQLYFGNSPKGALLVKKISSADNSPLSDVEFFVTDSTGAVVGDANGKYVTDSAGTFLVDGIAPGTTLVVRETRARPGYLLDDVPQTAVIRAGQTVKLEFRNQPQGNLIIQKLNSADKKTPLAGVQFKITYADGSYVDAAGGELSTNGLYYTDTNGQITLSGITGTVVVTETASIPGYTINPETRTQTVTVNPGGDTQTLYFYNDPVGGLDLVKVNEADRTERIPNTTFEIRRASDDALVDTVTTDKRGHVYVPLADNAYYAVEVEAGEGFRLDDTPIYFTVANGKTTFKTATNRAFSGILIHKVDSTTGKGIPNVTFLLYDSGHNPIGQFTSDQRGYAYIDDLGITGKVYLRELEAPGYVVDENLKTVYIRPGETTEVEWLNTPLLGQIQVIKTSADYNSQNGWAAGTPLPGAVFEVFDRANNLVDTIQTDKNGLATSKPLPLGRFTVKESIAPAFYGLNSTPMEAEIEFSGQIVRLAMADQSLYTNVSITKRGYAEVVPGQTIRYDFTGIGNNSTVPLESFFWRDTLPAQYVRLDKVVTGTYNVLGSYKVVYRTNLSGESWRTLRDNLSTRLNYVLDASPAALGLASNEYITEFMFSIGVVPANFRQVEAPQVHCTVYAWLTGGTQFTNQADVGGVYNKQWIMATSRWVTKVYKQTVPLPRTGY